MRSGFLYGSGRNSTASTTLKIAVLAPIPSARTVNETTVNTGLFQSERAVVRRFISGLQSTLYLQPVFPEQMSHVIRFSLIAFDNRESRAGAGVPVQRKRCYCTCAK